MSYASGLTLHFHGTGSGGELSLGSSAATLCHNERPLLLIDCGPGTLNAYQQAFHMLPEAIFLTHAHLDHIADLEILSVRAHLQKRPPIQLYVPISLITTLHQRLATYPGVLAEGGWNFWQSFQLLPVSDKFCHQGLTFNVHATRHHAPHSSFALHCPGLFFYSGDTRPIPEILHHCLSGQERIFHDCGYLPNPSHTGLEDLRQEYNHSLLPQFVLYHYANADHGLLLEQAGFTIAHPQQSFPVGRFHDV